MASPTASIARIGVVSDTHGILDPRARAALVGVSQIWHAGDIGAPAIIAELAAIAPVTAVRGNVDAGKAWAQHLPDMQQVMVAGAQLYMTHIGAKPTKLLQQLPEPRPAVYIFGHSHRSLLTWEAGILFLNPGAAGRPRFGGGLSVALLMIEQGRVDAQIILL